MCSLLYVGLVFNSTDHVTTRQIETVKENQTTSVPTFRGITAGLYEFNCSNINEIRLIRRLGTGTTRRAFLGEYRGRKVVVKTALRNISLGCISAFLEQQERPLRELLAEAATCPSKDIRHMLLEIIYHAVLNFPPFIRNLGYCMNTDDAVAGSYRSMNTTMSREIVGVYEYGEQVTADTLRAMNLSTKLYYTKQFMQLPYRMNDTIVGPVAMVDFQTRHLLLVNGQLKIFDLGLYVHEDIACGYKKNRNVILNRLAYRPEFGENNCAFGAPCIDGICQDMHFKLNQFILAKSLVQYFLLQAGEPSLWSQYM